MSFLEEHEDLVIPEANTGCWLWIGRCIRKGYGRLGDTYAHREAYESVHGPGTADGLEVRHKCDTPACVNPDHLLIGTHRDNMHDMVVRNRQNHFRGEEAVHAKLSDALVLDIRNRVKADELPAKIASDLGVTKGTILAAAKGKSWKHLRDGMVVIQRRLGSRNPQAKLNEAEAREIKSRIGFCTQRELADEFGVSKGAIKHIASGRNWGHVKV